MGINQGKEDSIQRISFFSWTIISGVVQAIYDHTEIEVIKSDLFHGNKLTKHIILSLLSGLFSQNIGLASLSDG